MERCIDPILNEETDAVLILGIRASGTEGSISAVEIETTSFITRDSATDRAGPCVTHVSGIDQVFVEQLSVLGY